MVNYYRMQCFSRTHNNCERVGRVVCWLLQVRSWVLPIGWSLSLCTISVKMWRVFVIYRTTKRLQSLKQKKVQLFLSFSL